MSPDNISNDFTSKLREKGRSESTVIAYNKDLQQLFEFLNNKKADFDLKELSTKLLEEYIDSLKQSGSYTLKTVSRKINSLKTFCKFLVEKGLIVSDISQQISHPEYKPQLPRTLSPLEYRALRDTARSNLRLYTMVELLLQTGMRIGELSRLKVKDINLKGAQAFIQPFSSNGQRYVDLNEMAVMALNSYLAQSKTKESDYLFQTRNGKAVLIRNIRTAIHRAFRKAGIKSATVNDIRNTFIVYQLENGLKLEKLAETVGHQKPTTTEKYLQLVSKRPKKTALKIIPL
jgi:site-specific recombinase XerD